MKTALMVAARPTDVYRLLPFILQLKSELEVTVLLLTSGPSDPIMPMHEVQQVERLCKEVGIDLKFIFLQLLSMDCMKHRRELWLESCAGPLQGFFGDVGGFDVYFMPSMHHPSTVAQAAYYLMRLVLQQSRVLKRDTPVVGFGVGGQPLPEGVTPPPINCMIELSQGMIDTAGQVFTNLYPPSVQAARRLDSGWQSSADIGHDALGHLVPEHSCIKHAMVGLFQVWKPGCVPLTPKPFVLFAKRPFMESLSTRYPLAL